jgi:Glycosyltransferases involved in cell wall biogenesis
MHERVSIVIPTYKENAYLGRTLENLRQQTVIDEAEIILADFNPDASTWYKAYLGPNVRYVQVDRKGIAYGRHKGIEASKGEVIVNFDADARYDTANALSYMTEPILGGRCVLTCCDNIFDLQGLSAKELEAMRIPIATANMLCAMQRTAHLACLEPGSAFSRQAYNVVGGYNDVMQHELWLLSHRIMLKYLPFNIQHVPQAAVYVSARRAKKFVDLGIGVLDYSNKAFR